MRPLKAALAVVVSVALAAPSSAQVLAASSAAQAVRMPLAAPVRISPLALPSSPSAASALTGLSAPAALSARATAPSAAAAPAFAAAAAPSASAAAAPAAAAPDAAPDVQAAAAEPGSSAAETLRAATALGAAVATPSSPAAADARGSWERFWSGARRTAPGFAVIAFTAAAAPALARAQPASGAPAILPAALAAPAVGGAHAFSWHAAPLLGGAAVLGAAYFVDRGARALIAKAAAKRGLDAHQVTATRLAASVVIWTAAIFGALYAGGASHQVLTTVLGAGGTVLTLSLRDTLGNVIQGVSFLLGRPYTVGDKVQVGDQTGRVSNLSLIGLAFTRDDGAEIKARHAALAITPVVVFAPFRESSERLSLTLPQVPRFHGAPGAVWHSLDRGFWVSAAAFAALLAAPALIGALAAGWPAAVVHYALAGSILWLTHRVVRATVAALDALGAKNGWTPEARVVARLFARLPVWLIGGGAFLRVLGLSWTTLGTSLGLTSVVLGLAANSFFGSVVLGAETLFTKPFAVGDRLRVGTFEGVVRDMTLTHVVIQLDENRRVHVPYSVIRDGVIVVQKGKAAP